MKSPGGKPYGRRYNKSNAYIKTKKVQGIGQGYMIKFIKAGSKRNKK